MPVPEELELKDGALIIFNKNSDLWCNGSLGIIKKCYKKYVRVTLLANNIDVEVFPEVWESYRYDINKKTKEITKTKTGEFRQLPLQLGYALTIHKAQGKTLDKVNIDMSWGAFAHGQLYVALSRTKNKEDMNIQTPLKLKDIIISDRIVEYMKDIK